MAISHWHKSGFTSQGLWKLKCKKRTVFTKNLLDTLQSTGEIYQKHPKQNKGSAIWQRGWKISKANKKYYRRSTVKKTTRKSCIIWVLLCNFILYTYTYYTYMVIMNRFDGVYLLGLKILDLSYNQIRRVDKLAFSKLGTNNTKLN